MHTITQAKALLGWEPRRFLKVLKAAAITPAQDAYDRRVFWLSDGDLERMRQVYEDIYGGRGTPPARINELEERMEALERRLAALEARSVPPAPLPRVLAPPRQIASTAAYTPRATPTERVAFTSWCKEHGVFERTAERMVAAGRLPQPEYSEEGWRGPTGQTFFRSYSPAQHREASRQAAVRWPAHFQACDDCRAYVAGAADGAGVDGDAPHAPDAVAPGE